MTDFFKTKENEFYIELKEERYYIPGEDISGDVILDLKKATKTNNIKVALEGIVEIAGRTLSLFTRSIIIAESLDGQRSYYLEPHTHRFPFRITIPSSKTTKVPSTLQIPRVLKVSYKLTATYNKTYTVLEKFCPTASVNVNILEDINVEKDGLLGEKKMEKELKLSNKKKARVYVNIGKRAAVKGDVVPVTVKIEYDGKLNKDKGVSAQLLRSVHYGRHRSEIFGPKSMRQVTSNLLDSTKTINMKLPIPSQLCPTVDKSGQSFKIEYSIRVKVNLNEPNRPENKGDIATFNAPFIIGTYPKLSFNIDDDYDEEEEKDEEIDANEYDQIAEKMKNMDFLESDIQLDEPEINRVQRQGTVTHIDPTLTSLQHKPLPLEPIKTSHQHAEILSPPIEKLTPTYNHSPSNRPPSPPKQVSPPIKTDPFMQDVHRTNSASSRRESMYQTPINSRPNSINYHTSPSRQNTVHSIERQESLNYQPGFHRQDSVHIGRQESFHQPNNNIGLGRQESFHNNVGVGRQESFHQSNVSLGRQESVRWVKPPPINNPPYPTTNQEPPISMPTPFLPPLPPQPQYPNQQAPFMPYPQSYPLDNMGGFPIPQHDPLFPPMNNGFINMPSATNYQQPSYPYHPYH